MGEMIMARYQVEIPPTRYNDSGYSPVYCPADAADWGSLTWSRYGSGGNAPCRHMFVDDWRLEPLWRNQRLGLAHVMACHVVTAPDFTIDLHYPLPLAHYQVWRSSALASFWQSLGAVTVPVLQWGAEETFSVCTAGIKKGSVVAVRGPSKGTEKRWIKGAEYMRDHIEPSLVLFFGRKVEGVFSNTFFSTLR
jgi:hypothetical protein